MCWIRTIYNRSFSRFLWIEVLFGVVLQDQNCLSTRDVFVSRCTFYRRSRRRLCRRLVSEAGILPKEASRFVESTDGYPLTQDNVVVVHCVKCSLIPAFLLGVAHSNAEHVNVVADWTLDEERRLLRKLDFRVLLPCCLVYFVAYLDRANMGYAATLQADTNHSLSADLDLHGSDFSWAVSITYFAVTLLLVPSNLSIKRLSGKYWFPPALIVLGVVVCSMSAVKSLGGLLAARFFLGVPEAAIPSGCKSLSFISSSSKLSLTRYITLKGLMYFTFWYKPSERALRVGIFEASNALATAVGGFIAIGVDTLDGKAGLESWRSVSLLMDYEWFSY